VTAQRRHRSVDDAGVQHFVGVRLTVTSPEALLYAPDRLVEVVRAAKENAAEARASGRWDTVDEIELVTGNDALRMSTAEFAQYVDDLRTRRPQTLR
jgi:hypothetical protein